MSVPSVRSKRSNLRSEQKSSQTSMPSKSNFGLRSRSMNLRNTPSPTANVRGEKLTEKVSKKIVAIYCDQDENSMPPQECQEPVRLKSTKIDVSTSKATHELSTPCPVTTSDVAIQVNSADFDDEISVLKSEDELTLEDYRRMATERQAEAEELAKTLDDTKTNLLNMSNLNLTLSEENGTLIKRCEEYEIQISELVEFMEQTDLDPPEQASTSQS